MISFKNPKISLNNLLCVIRARVKEENLKTFCEAQSVFMALEND